MRGWDEMMEGNFGSRVRRLGLCADAMGMGGSRGEVWILGGVVIIDGGVWTVTTAPHGFIDVRKGSTGHCRDPLGLKLGIFNCM